MSPRRPILPVPGFPTERRPILPGADDRQPIVPNDTPRDQHHREGPVSVPVPMPSRPW